MFRFLNQLSRAIYYLFARLNNLNIFQARGKVVCWGDGGWRHEEGDSEPGLPSCIQIRWAFTTTPNHRNRKWHDEGSDKKGKLISFHWLDNFSYFRFHQFIILFFWSFEVKIISEVALFAKKHSQYAAAKIFNVARRRIFDWMRQIPKLEELIAKGHMKKMTGRGPKNRDIDQALYNWYCERKANADSQSTCI